jgi:hypothetical protein
VLSLRGGGHRVYRAGRDTTLFNGVRIPNAAVERFAAAEPRRG